MPSNCRSSGGSGSRSPEKRRTKLVSPEEVSPVYSGLTPSLASKDWQRIASRLGLLTELERAFRCPLPGHAERRPSAAWYTDAGGEVVLHDFHRRSGPEFFTLVEVYAAVRSGRVKKLRGPSHAIWARRMAVDFGMAVRARVEWPTLPRTASTSTRRVYEGLQLLFGVRWMGSAGEPAPLSWSFVADWCRVGERQAGEAIQELVRLSCLRKAGRFKRITLFLPGPCTPVFASGGWPTLAPAPIADILPSAIKRLADHASESATR